MAATVRARERWCARLRPTPMNRPMLPRLAAVATLVLLGAATGCGSTGSTTASTRTSASSVSASPMPQASVGTCTPEDDAVTGAAVFGQADLDGDGAPEDLHVLPADSSCGSVLFATVDGTVLSTTLGAGGLVGEVTPVAVPGRQGVLAGVREVAPRGGYQVHLYGPADDALGEVTVDGNPVVPFVATDTEPTPMTVRCTADGLVLDRAVAHEPPGVLFTYDIRRTTYALSGLIATAAPEVELADNVLPAKLRTAYPALARQRLFTGC